jgi:hypothetical protein
VPLKLNHLLFRSSISKIFKERKVSEAAQAAITLLQLAQEKQQKSATSSDRKDRILNLLFQQKRETLIKLNLIRGLLMEFHGYVKEFQSEKPLIHTLHSRMYDVTTELFSFFIKPEYIPNSSVRKLLKVDVTDRGIQKSDKDLNVGKYAYADLNKARMDKACSHWVTSLYSRLRTGYIMAAKKLLQLPLDNKTIRLMSVLDPHMVGHNQTAVSFKEISNKLPNVLTHEENGQLSVEVDKYNIDRQVKDLSQDYKEDDRIDTMYWSKVFSLTNYDEVRYPMMQKLVKTVLCIFSGPLIESTFNIMDDIVEKDRTKLTVVNYEAVAIVKTALRKKNVKSTDLIVNNSMKSACINAYATYRKYLQSKRVEDLKKHEEKLSTSVQLLKIEKAKKLANLVRLKNRIVSRNSKKRKSEANESARKWKRIKTA